MLLGQRNLLQNMPGAVHRNSRYCPWLGREYSIMPHNKFHFLIQISVFATINIKKIIKNIVLISIMQNRENRGWRRKTETERISGLMAYSHCTGTGLGQVQGMGLGIIYFQIGLIPGHEQDPLSPTMPVPFPVPVSVPVPCSLNVSSKLDIQKYFRHE